jgi:thiosulfate/3-mercaptopyruvate sulfurtransferase
LPAWNFKKWLTGVVLVLGMIPAVSERSAMAVPGGNYAHPEVLIQPEELKGLIDERTPGLQIIDVRDKPQYLMGHIPGAVQLWRPDIEDEKHPLTGMMASHTKVEEVLGKRGISDKSTLIIYSGLYDHARLWWLLAFYGFPLRQMKLLDGGIDAWKRKKYSMEMIPPRVKETRFGFPGEAKRVVPLLCTLPEVKGALKDPEKVVLDVRSQKEYFGEEIKSGPFKAKAGHIPGVVWIEWQETLVSEGPYRGYWKPAEEIKRIFSAKGVTSNKDIYVY